MATFVFKLLTLTIRTASKPLASRFQSYVLTHPTLRPAVLRFAQGIHKLDFAMSRFAEGKPIGTSKKFVAALDDDRAMDLAGKFVSEGFVLAVAVGILAWEYNRNNVKDADKKAKEDAYRRAVENKFADCDKRLLSLGKQNRAMIEAIQQRQDALEQQLHQLYEERQRKLQRSWSFALGAKS